MRASVRDAVGLRKYFELKARLAIDTGPVQALWPQRVGHTHDINEIKSGIASKRIEL